MRGKMRDGYADPPQGVGMYITQRCNLGCKMCYVRKETDPKELPTADMKRVFHRIRNVASRFAMAGGEPLMREDIAELLEYANGEGLRPELLTNATLITKEIAKAIVKYCKGIIVSIEGDRETHDSIRGKGSFDKTMRGIRLVREAGDTIIRINATISKLNVAKLDEIVDIASDLKCGLSFQHLIFSTPEQTEQHKQALKDVLDMGGNTIPRTISNLNELDIDLLIRELRISETKANYVGLRFHTTPPLWEEEQIWQWYSGLEPIDSLGCVHPWNVLFMRQDGEVLPCEFIQYPLGNLAEQEMEEIWNGDKARHFRKTWRERGLFPGCVRCCKLANYNNQGGDE